jgi:lambda repressor-like predicted transcriptional regulator
MERLSALRSAASALLASAPEPAVRAVLKALLASKEVDAPANAANGAQLPVNYIDTLSSIPRSATPIASPARPSDRLQDDSRRTKQPATEWLPLRARVQETRRATGLTMGQLAETIGYAVSTVQGTLDKLTPPSQAIRAKLLAWVEEQDPALPPEVSGAFTTKAPEGPDHLPFRASHHGNGSAIGT